jgi:hypothetical protein
MTCFIIAGRCTVEQPTTAAEIAAKITVSSDERTAHPDPAMKLGANTTLPAAVVNPFHTTKDQSTRPRGADKIACAIEAPDREPWNQTMELEWARSVVAALE